MRASCDHLARLLDELWRDLGPALVARLAEGSIGPCDEQLMMRSAIFAGAGATCVRLARCPRCRVRRARAGVAHTPRAPRMPHLPPRSTGREPSAMGKEKGSVPRRGDTPPHHTPPHGDRPISPLDHARSFCAGLCCGPSSKVPRLMSSARERPWAQARAQEARAPRARLCRWPSCVHTSRRSTHTSTRRTSRACGTQRSLETHLRPLLPQHAA